MFYECNQIMWENEEEIDSLEISVLNQFQWNLSYTDQRAVAHEKRLLKLEEL